MQPVLWKILLIDDDEEDYYITRGMLSEMKRGQCILDWASSYDSGWLALQSGLYDAILVDYDLGPKTGLELTSQALASGLKAPLILFTGRGSYEVDLEAMQAGASLYLTKGETTPLMLERGIHFAIERKQNELALAQANLLLEQQKQALEETNLRLKESLTAHRQSEERFRSLFEGMNEGFALHEIITDEAGRACDYLFLEINPAFERLTGLSRDQVVGRLMSEVLPEDDPEWIQIFGEVALTGSPAQFDKYSLVLQQHYSVFAYSPAPRQFAVIFRDITQFKRKDEAYQQNLNQLQAVIDHLSDGLLVTDPEGNILLANPAALNLIGDPPDPPSNISAYPSLLELVDSSGNSLPFEDWPLSRALRGENVRDLELTLRYHTRAEDFVALYSAVPVFNEQRQVRLAVLTVREITEHTRTQEGLLQRRMELEIAQEEVENEKRRLQAVMEALPVGVVITDTQGNILLTNRSYHQLWGGEPPLGTKPTDHKTYQAWWAETGELLNPSEWGSARAMRTGKTVLGQLLEIQRFDGTRLSVLNNASPIRDASGKIVGSAAAIHDITNLRKIEQELRDRENELRLIIDAEPVLISYIDSNFCYRRVNKSYERWFGVSAEESEGKHVSQVLGEAAWEAVRPYMEAAVRGELVSYERELPYAGGARWVHVVYTPDFSSSGKVRGFVVHVSDISDRIQAQEAMHKYAEQLRLSNKELENFAFIVSHDLKEPLRKVERFGQQIQKSALHLLPETERDYLDRMIQAAARMRKMIDDLLSLSQVTSEGQPFVRVDLNEVVHSVMDDLEITIQQTRAVVEIGRLPTIKADPLQMHLLFQNLVANALKFHTAGQPPQVSIGTNPPTNGLVEIWVADRGIGFDMKYASRLFRPFQRLHTRSEYDGSGIGLAICHKIVERHGGLITAHSQPGQGARFTLKFPL